MEISKKRVIRDNKKYTEDYVSDFSTEQTSDDENDVINHEANVNDTISNLLKKTLPNITSIQALSTTDKIKGIRLPEESTEKAAATVRPAQQKSSNTEKQITIGISPQTSQTHVLDSDLAELIKFVSMGNNQLGEMTETIENLRKDINKMKSEFEPPEDLPSLPDAFPIKNIDDWKKFNTTIDKVEYRQIVNYFTSLGGRSPNESINLMISEALDPALAKELTWTGIGKNGTKNTENAVVKSRLYRACYAGLSYRNRFGKITKKDLQVYMTAGLKSAKERKRTADKKKKNIESQPEDSNSDMELEET